jgi:flagella basal body P-ring formation protein FlgA
MALLLGTAIAAAAEKQSALAVKLRSSARSAGPFIRLDEVAELSGAGADRAGKVLLGRVPRPGARAALKRKEVELRLEEEGFERRRFTVTGAEEVMVDPLPAKRLTPKPAATRKPVKRVPERPAVPENKLAGAFAAWVRKSLAARLHCPPEKLNVRVSGRIRGEIPECRLEDLAAEVQWPVGRIRLGRLRLGVLLKRSGRRVARLEANVETAARLKVLVAARNLRRDELIMPGDAVLSELLLTDLGGNYLSDSRGLTGICAARSVRAGEPLRANMLKKQKLVRRGQPVTLVAVSGAVRVTARGIAKGDGGLHDVVVVDRGRKRRPVTGRVVGNGIVKVE